MTAQTNPSIGVIGAPTVAKALTQIGYQVHTGPTLAEAATAVTGALAARPFPVIADFSYSGELGYDLYLASLKPQTSMLVIIPDGGTPITVDGAQIVALPTTVNAILPLLGFSASASPAGFTPVGVPDSAPSPDPIPAVIAAAVTPPATPSVVEVEAEPTIFAPDPAPTVAAPAGPAAPDDFMDLLFNTAPAAPDAIQAGHEPVQIHPPTTVPAQLPQVQPEPLQQDTAQDTTAWTPEPDAPQITHNPYTVQPAVAPAPVPEPAPAPVAVFAAAPVPVPTPAPADQWAGALAPTTPARVSGSAFEYAGVEDMFGASAVTVHNRVVREGGARPLLIVFAPKGGVTKTATSLNLAKIASEAGLKVVLVDANPGQGDIGTRMRIPEGAFNTIFDAASAADPTLALLRPNVYNPARPFLSPLGFSVILAPPKDLAGDPRMTPTVYQSAIEYARTQADLVIVDTQIIEAHHSALFDELIIPEMVAGAWSVTVLSEDYTATVNLKFTAADLARHGVDPSRSLLLAARWEQFDEAKIASIQREFGSFGTFIGHVSDEPIYRANANTGEFRTDLPGISVATRAVLYTVTGNPDFAPAVPKKRWSLQLFGGRSSR